MRATPNLAVEKNRLRDGPMASSRHDGNNGAFHFTYNGARLVVIASDGEGWDHVSVSLRDRCPTWDEMCYVKDLVFEPEETVIQYHPPKSVYGNAHDYCLHMWRPQGVHMWRPQGVEIPLPDPMMVAP